jgi:hypothetical protein
MGHNFAQELASGELTLPLEEAIAIHLRSNHYPPVPLSMVTPCIEAIDKCNEGDSGALIDLPDPIKWKGASQAPAYAVIEGHHLEPWVQWDD